MMKNKKMVAFGTSMLMMVGLLAVTMIAPTVTAHTCSGVDDSCGECEAPDGHNHRDTYLENGDQGCTSDPCVPQDYNCYLGYLRTLIENQVETLPVN